MKAEAEIARLKAENAIMKAKNDKLKAILEEISKEIYCVGPDCPWCEDGTHPPTHGACLAQNALKEARG